MGLIEARDSGVIHRSCLINLAILSFFLLRVLSRAVLIHLVFATWRACTWCMPGIQKNLGSLTCIPRPSTPVVSQQFRVGVLSPMKNTRLPDEHEMLPRARCSRGINSRVKESPWRLVSRIDGLSTYGEEANKKRGERTSIDRSIKILQRQPLTGSIMPAGTARYRCRLVPAALPLGRNE